MQLCTHIKMDGHRCGSPALRESSLCHFHHNYGQPRPLPRGGKRKSSPTVELPVLEDANSVQVALMQIIGGLLDGSIDDRKAALLLWALQIASANSKRVKFEDHNATIRSWLHQARVEGRWNPQSSSAEQQNQQPENGEHMTPAMAIQELLNCPELSASESKNPADGRQGSAR